MKIDFVFFCIVDCKIVDVCFSCLHQTFGSFIIEISSFQAFLLHSLNSANGVQLEWVRYFGELILSYTKFLRSIQRINNSNFRVSIMRLVWKIRTTTVS